MKTNQNPFMRFFSSVRLTIFTLFILAVTSIIGTVIPQKKPPEFYVDAFGENMATLFQLLSVPDMYNSWWFLFFLILLSINLIICTINRFPRIWSLITADVLAQDPERLQKMPNRVVLETNNTMNEATDILSETFKQKGWQPGHTDKNGGILIGAQKGSWTRLGVIAVHTSIIVIFIGAIIGSVFGYKASVMIPEGAGTEQVYKFGTSAPIPLGFTVQCDSFSLTYYETGAPKEYRSDLRVIEDGKEVLNKSIVVNDPMDYKGLTFYQSSYEAMNNYLAHIKDTGSQEEQQFLIAPGRQIKWTDDITFGIINMTRSGRMGGMQYKIWFKDTQEEPSTFWVADNETYTLTRPSATYSFTLKQRYATGLQVTKDPGVWYVYSGCGLMILGLFIAFFLSHRRIWAFTIQDGQKTKIVLAGSANKNKLGLEKDIDSLTVSLKSNDKINFNEDQS